MAEVLNAVAFFPGLCVCVCVNDLWFCIVTLYGYVSSTFLGYNADMFDILDFPFLDLIYCLTSKVKVWLESASLPVFDSS